MKPVIAAALLIVLIISSCTDNYTPKPRGYHRIEFPEHEYQRYETDCPYTFEYHKRAQPDFNRIDTTANPCRFNLYYPDFDAKLYFTYFGEDVESKLAKYTEDSRELVNKHMVKAQDIDEYLIESEKDNVYGIVFDFKGSTATNYQFFLTDSTNHYIHGSMYFEFSPNPDSITPVEHYIKKDIEHLINTFKWKSR